MMKEEESSKILKFSSVDVGKEVRLIKLLLFDDLK